MEEARLNSLEALRLIREDESRPVTFLPLTILARAEWARNDLRRAGLLWGALEAEAERSPHPTWQRVRPERAAQLLDETSAAFLSAVEDGRALDLWDAVDIALSEDEAQTVP